MRNEEGRVSSSCSGGLFCSALGHLQPEPGWDCSPGNPGLGSWGSCRRGGTRQRWGLGSGPGKTRGIAFGSSGISEVTLHEVMSPLQAVSPHRCPHTCSLDDSQSCPAHVETTTTALPIPAKKIPLPISPGTLILPGPFLPKSQLKLHHPRILLVPKSLQPGWGILANPFCSILGSLQAPFQDNLISGMPMGAADPTREGGILTPTG